MKRTTHYLALSILLVFALTFSACTKGNPAKSFEFTQWNDAPALTALKDYVATVTDKNSSDFIPEEDRIATFDMDGTFMGELYPTYFEYLILEYRVLEDPSYKDKASASEVEAATAIRNFCRNGTALPSGFDLIHGKAAAKAYAGMTLSEFDSYVKEFCGKKVNGFENMTYADTSYKPMLEIFDYLKANKFTCYVVTGSDRFLARSLTSALGIPANRIIGMDVELKASGQGEVEGVNYTFSTDDTLVRGDKMLIKNLKTNKVKNIAQEIGKVPVLSFGNSGGDCAMHNYCLSNPTYRSMAFMLVADDDERDHPNLEKTLKLIPQWKEAGYQVISMKNDFKTIYGDFKKTDFAY
ncbi:MAG: haloacid dehalogenase-like hydrolase [Treponemataceae bacterium]|nr:haloacid dehalogenase-like hydrolase [Treponemataceae bacterium]